MKFSIKRFFAAFFFVIAFASSAFAASSWQEIKDLGFKPGDKTWATKHNTERDELYNTLSVSINPDGTLKSTTTASQWITASTAVTYASASAFKVVDAEAAVFIVGRKAWVNQAIDVIGVVASTSSSGGNTTVNLTSIVLYSDNSTTSTVTTPITSVSVGIDTLRSDPSPITNAGRGAYSNLKIIRPTASTIDVSADSITLATSTATYDATSVNLTGATALDITAAGANGRDTGSEANDTFYAVWVIYDGTTVAGLLSVSDTTPTMPAGYTYKRLVGFVKNDSSGNFIDYKQFNWKVRYMARLASATGLASATYVAQDVSGQAPTASGRVSRVQVAWTSTTDTAILFVSHDGTNMAANMGATSNSNAIGQLNELGSGFTSGSSFVMPSGNNIYYLRSSGTGTANLFVLGYDLNL